jgi:hypothetical protein
VFWAASAFAAEVPSIDESAPRGSAHRGDAALVVANEDYAFLPDVPYANRDADAVALTLTDVRGIPPERVRILHGANREQILEAFDAVAAQVSDGTLWVYFSGHGASSPSTTEPLLVGDDAKRDAAVFQARSVSLPELRTRAGDRSLVVVTDACFTGAGRGGEELVPGARFVVPQWAIDLQQRQLLVTATGPDQVAGPYVAARHGLFTWLFAGALRGWADGARDGSRDGTVTVGEVDTFLTRSLAILQVHDQSPVFRGGAPEQVLVESEAFEVAPDLRSLPLPGALTAPQPAPPSRGDPVHGSVVHVRGSSWSIADQPASSFEVKALAIEDPLGAAAVRSQKVLPYSHLGAGYLLMLGAAFVPVGLTLKDETTTTGGAVETELVFGPALPIVGGVGLLSGVAWEVWIAHRTKQNRAAMGAAAERTLGVEAP